MGYTTTFTGAIEVQPALNKQEIEYLDLFADTRRMRRNNGPYFVGGSGFKGQGLDSDILDHNHPPEGQPSLWCQWIPNDDGTAIVWDGNEKFYSSDEWMKYLIQHFLGSDPEAKRVDPAYFAFLQGHTLNGEIKAQGEDFDDRWKLIVVDNVISIKELE